MLPAPPRRPAPTVRSAMTPDGVLVWFEADGDVVGGSLDDRPIPVAEVRARLAGL